MVPGVGHGVPNTLASETTPCPLCSLARAKVAFFWKPVLTGPASAHPAGLFWVFPRRWALIGHGRQVFIGLSLHVSWLRTRGHLGVCISVHRCMRTALGRSSLETSQLPHVGPRPLPPASPPPLPHEPPRPSKSMTASPPPLWWGFTRATATFSLTRAGEPGTWKPRPNLYWVVTSQP